MPPSDPGNDPAGAAIAGLREVNATLDPFRFRAWADLGLTTAQLRVLSIIRDEPGITGGELAARLAVTAPTMSGIVDRLARQDFVRREDDLIDRRLVRTFVTDQGEQCYGQLADDVQRFMRRVMDVMPPADLGALLRGLEAFMTAFDAVRCAARDEPPIEAPGA